LQASLFASINEACWAVFLQLRVREVAQDDAARCTLPSIAAILAAVVKLQKQTSIAEDGDERERGGEREGARDERCDQDHVGSLRRRTAPLPMNAKAKPWLRGAEC
jgi:hypothetical protein